MIDEHEIAMDDLAGCDESLKKRIYDCAPRLMIRRIVNRLGKESSADIFTAMGRFEVIVRGPYGIGDD